MAKLSEGIIAKTLWRKYGIGQWAVPNIYYYAFESDLLILRKSGTVIEYEIKLSVGDFNAGLKKRARIDPYNKNRRVPQMYIDNKESVSRHGYLTSGLGANMFYYVAPQEVFEAVDVPDWAGIIQVRTNTAANSCGSVIKKKASYLHKEKASEKLKEKMMTSCYYKYWQHYAVRDVNHVMRRTR